MWLAAASRPTDMVFNAAMLGHALHAYAATAAAANGPFSNELCTGRPSLTPTASRQSLPLLAPSRHARSSSSPPLESLLGLMAGQLTPSPALSRIVGCYRLFADGDCCAAVLGVAAKEGAGEGGSRREDRRRGTEVLVVDFDIACGSISRVW